MTYGQLALDFGCVVKSAVSDICLSEDVNRLLSQGCVVAIGVSGGKDSQACAIVVASHLNKIGHTGPRVLVHADLGLVEWKDSLPTCERLAKAIGWELLVVRRKAGDMMARWEGRWNNNIARYSDLETVKVILPWSTPGMRFCTSELKSEPISSALRKRFPKMPILNVAGIRREEGPGRSNKPVSTPDPRLMSSATEAYTWNAIVDWKIGQVFNTVAAAGLDLHDGYRLYGMTRISCAFCIMGSLPDLTSSASCRDNQEVYRRMVDLEIASTFAFQGSRWLADVAPDLLLPGIRAAVALAKYRATVRCALEARIPKDLLFVKGVPVRVPTTAEAEIIADVRKQMGGLLGYDFSFTTPDSIKRRYEEMLKDNEFKEAA